MCVYLNDLLVRLSCRSQQTKIAYIAAYRSHKPNRLADRLRDASLLSGWHVMYLPSYCVGVTQYIYISVIISSRCEGMKSSAAPAKNDYRLVRLLLSNVENDIALKFVSWPLKINIGSKKHGKAVCRFFIAVSVTTYTAARPWVAFP